MKIDESEAGRRSPVKPSSPEANKIYINTLCLDAREIETIAAGLAEAGYEVETDNTLCFGAEPQVKYATLLKNEALAVAKNLKNSGWNIPVKEEPMLNAGDCGIVVFLVDTSGLMNFWIKEARRNVEELEEDARKLPRLNRMTVQDIIDKKGLSVLDDFNLHDESAWDALAMLQKIANIHLKLLAANPDEKKHTLAVINGLNAILALKARIEIAEHVREMIFNFSNELAKACREAIKHLQTKTKRRA